MFALIMHSILNPIFTKIVSRTVTLYKNWPRSIISDKKKTIVLIVTVMVVLILFLSN